MARFQAHAERFGTEMIFDHIHTVDLLNRPFTSQAIWVFILAMP